MSNGQLSRRIALAIGGSALAVMGTLTACSSTKEKEAPSSPASTPASTSPAAPSSTQKAILPGGDQSFSPTVNPMPPGAVCKQIVNGVCIR